MIEKLDPIAITKMLTELVTQWERKQIKCRKGENVVYDALIHEGYEITRFPMIEEGEISIKRKKEKLKESRFPDAFARYHGDGEPLFDEYFFFDPKYKGKRMYLGVVNVHDYDGYFAFIRYGHVQVPFKIFFYLDDVKEIWIHDLRNPKAEPNLKSTIEDMRGKSVYRIFASELEFWKRVYTD